jgi:hypothetical protein
MTHNPNGRRSTMPKGNQKGSAFERTISKQLSLWWTEGERDDVFWRSTQSGGRATQRAKSGKTTASSYGDIAPLDSIGKPFTDYFCIELKRGYSSDTEVLGIIDSRKNNHKLFEFYFQCERDKELGGMKESLVIFKRDRRTACIMFRPLYNSILTRLFGNQERLKMPYIQISHPDIPMGLIVMDLDDWFEWIDPVTLNKFIEGRFDKDDRF